MHGVAKLSLGGVWLGRLLPVMLGCGFALTSWGNTFTVTNTANSGPGSFSQAITDANANTNLDTINFSISGTPPFTITLTSALPAIQAPVVIDATTQPGFTNKPVIELNGAATSGIGLRFLVGASTLRGMAINRFPVQAIELDSASNSIQGNFIGTDVTGTVARGNGIPNYPSILVKSGGNLIGGTNTGDGNLISGNKDTGLYLLNANSNIVQGNLIGVTADGTASLSNLSDGIVLYGSGYNLIGGLVPSATNIISGNGASGVYLTGATATGNVIQGNRIGTDSSGSNAVGNVANDGISIIGAPGNLICSNLISANGLTGVAISGNGAISNVLIGNFIGTDVNGKTSLGNHDVGVKISGTGGNQIGGTNAGDGNVISGNFLDGIALTGSTSNNVIQGNLIGLSAAGTNALHNGQNGISINGGSSNIVGGVTAGARNVISGNFYNGIGILLLTDRGNTVLGNYIGTDTNGTKAIPNALAGVRIQGCSNTIGGVVVGATNVISGNSQQGIWLVGTNGNVTGNVIQGNIIGLDVSGANSLGNGDAGVGITSASKNQVGGTATGARNILSGNSTEGVFLTGDGTSNNIVQGNYIGTDVTGMVGLGNLLQGITVQGAGTTQIGGTNSGARNLISGNGNKNWNGGILVTNSSGNVIQGNWIGTKADGVSDLHNFGHNIDLQAATNNIIGGVAPGAGNRIAFAQDSLRSGVRVRAGAYNNLISGNSIFSNGALGIDLGVVRMTPNVDCETGMTVANANAGQNYPILTNVYSGTSTRIKGTINSKTGQTYTLQFFASPTGNASGYGEGQVYLGQTNVTLGAVSCSTNFTAYLPVSVSPGWVVTATATDAANNTSEFSHYFASIPVPPVQAARLTGTNQLTLSWTNNGGSFTLQQATNLTPPITWLAVTNVPVLSNNFMVTTLRSTNGSVFYRLLTP